MTNLDNILWQNQYNIVKLKNKIKFKKKSRDITLPTNVRLVKAMVFPIAMYGCESWTIKKAQHRRVLLNCGVEEDS